MIMVKASPSLVSFEALTSTFERFDELGVPVVEYAMFIGECSVGVHNRSSTVATKISFLHYVGPFFATKFVFYLFASNNDIYNIVGVPILAYLNAMFEAPVILKIQCFMLEWVTTSSLISTKSETPRRIFWHDLDDIEDSVFISVGVDELLDQVLFLIRKRVYDLAISDVVKESYKGQEALIVYIQKLANFFEFFSFLD